MRTLIPRPWTTAKVLTALLGAALALATFALILLLAATPPFECGTDYQSPPTPLASGGIAILTLLFGVVSVFVGSGLKLGLSKSSPDQRWATWAIVLAVVVLLVAGGGAFADVTRWSCWE
jgi:hypothetical protein